MSSSRLRRYGIPFPRKPEPGHEFVLCAACNGSGEGHYEGTRCGTCGGGGEVEVEVPEQAQPTTAVPDMQPLPNHDNHHNALLCPYCNPRKLKFAEPDAAPAVREPLHAWEFVAMWATAAEKHDVTHDIVVEFGRAVEAHHGITGDSNG